MRRGLSLIEILVAIAIVGVLIAILVPVLAGARSVAKDTRRLAWAGQLGQATNAYTNDFDGLYPYLGTPRSSTGPITYREDVLSTKPFRHRYFWMNAIRDSHLSVDAREVPGVITDPPENGIFGNVPDDVLVSGWTLSNTTCAVVAFWRPGASIDEGQLVPMGAHQLVFPSGKVILSRAVDGIASGIYAIAPDEELEDPDAARQLVLGDGSARVYDRDEVTGNFVEDRPTQWGALALPMEATVDGIAGIDIP